MDMLPDKETKCHHTGFQSSCRDMVVNCSCRKWRQIQGKNPNTGEDVNGWDCVDAWLPLLMIENSQMQRQTGAAVESLRNEMVKAATAQQQLQIQALRQQQQISAPRESAALRALPVA
jgi:hypothetical protein